MTLATPGLQPQAGPQKEGAGSEEKSAKNSPLLDQKNPMIGPLEKGAEETAKAKVPALEPGQELVVAGDMIEKVKNQLVDLSQTKGKSLEEIQSEAAKIVGDTQAVFKKPEAEIAEKSCSLSESIVNGLKKTGENIEKKYDPIGKATGLVEGVKNFVTNPGKTIVDGSKALASAAQKKVSGMGDAITEKINGIKEWYATPEGKAKFWKSVTLVAVGVAVVASGGALTAPAFALAAGISAAGGVAAQVVENKVYNAAAKTKAEKDQDYQFEEKDTFDGVSAQSMTIDALMGSVGGPMIKYAGKALVGSAVALGKGVSPALSGIGELGAGLSKSTLNRVLPESAKKALGSVASFVKDNAKNAAELGKKAVEGGKNMVEGAKNHMDEMLEAAYRETSVARSYLMEQTKTLREFVANTAKVPQKVRDYVSQKVTDFRTFDKKLLESVKEQYDSSPVVKMAQGVRNAVDGAGDKVSKGLVNLKVKAADGLDKMTAKAGEKISESGAGKYLRNVKETTIARLDDMIANNPESHYSKAILEFRSSGTAIRTHLDKVWTDASQGLNKDLSRLLGRRGSVQADFKQFAEEGSKEAYEQEIKLAREAAEERLKKKVREDYEYTRVRQIVDQGQDVSDAQMTQIREEAANQANEAAGKAAERLTLEAETFVARHPSMLLEDAALKVEAIEAQRKVMEHYFGKDASQKGLLERTGMAITAPVRKPINERMEKYTKMVETIKNNSPLGATVMIGNEVVVEQIEKEVSESIEGPIKEWANKLKGEDGKSKESTTEDGTVINDILDNTYNSLFNFLDIEEWIESMLKQANIDPKDIEKPDLEKEENPVAGARK